MREYADVVVGTYVIDGSGVSGAAWGVEGPAGASTFASGMLIVIVVVPPGTVEVMRRVIVLVTSGLGVCQRIYGRACSTRHCLRGFIDGLSLVDFRPNKYCSACHLCSCRLGDVFFLDRCRHAVGGQSLRGFGKKRLNDELRRAGDCCREVHV